MNVNFNGFGENAATFIADKTLTEAGVPVKMKDNGTVAKCDASENFCGVCVSVRGGCLGGKTPRKYHSCRS